LQIAAAFEWAKYRHADFMGDEWVRAHETTARAALLFHATIRYSRPDFA
jgi:hypothetical protein